MKINLGCGATPTPGWTNLDHSPTILLARTPLARFFRGRHDFMRVVREHDIRYATALNLRLPRHSVDVLYTSHMLDHPDMREASGFLERPSGS